MAEQADTTTDDAGAPPFVGEKSAANGNGEAAQPADGLANGSVSEPDANADADPNSNSGADVKADATQGVENANDGVAEGSAAQSTREQDTGEHGAGQEAKENGTRGEDSEDDPFAGLDDVASMDIYDLSNYTFGKKNQESKSKAMQQLSTAQVVDALRKNYNDRGMRRSVGGVILVHSHNFPHILLLQRSDGKGQYALPGGRLRPGESDEEGLRRKLNAKLKPTGPGAGEDDQELDIGEKICNWYAIDFQRRFYPYVPAHVTKPKEELHIYTVLLPNKFMFSVPKNLQIVAVPLFELFNNPSTYGDVISAVPALLSRWHINYC